MSYLTPCDSFHEICDFFLTIVWWSLWFFRVPLRKFLFIFYRLTKYIFFFNQITKFAIFFCDELAKFSICSRDFGWNSRFYSQLIIEIWDYFQRPTKKITLFFWDHWRNSRYLTAIHWINSWTDFRTEKEKKSQASCKIKKLRVLDKNHMPVKRKEKRTGENGAEHF